MHDVRQSIWNAILFTFGKCSEGMQRLTTPRWEGSSPKHTAQRVSASKSFKQTGMVLEHEWIN